MMMIYLSFIYEDLKEYRQAVVNAMRKWRNANGLSRGPYSMTGVHFP